MNALVFCARWRRLLRRCNWFVALAVLVSLRAEEQIREPEVIASRIPKAETGFERDHMTGNWRGRRTRLVERGIHFSSGYTAEVLSNLRGGERRGSIVAGLWEASLDLTPEKMGGWKDGLFHISTLYPHGRSLSRYVGDLAVLSNIDADDVLVLFELWYEHRFWNEKFSIRVGQLAADEEFAGSEYGSALISSTFGWAAFISANTPAPAFPLAAPGLRLRLAPTENWFVQLGVFDGNPDPRDARGRRINKHGVRFELNEAEGALAILEAGHNRGKAQLPGTYKLGLWGHSGDFANQRFDRRGLSLADPRSEGEPRQHQGNVGIYAVIDQRLWREASEGPESEQGLGVFWRAGASPRDRNLLEFQTEGGLHFKGLLPSRDEDVLAFGVAYWRLSRDLRALDRDRRDFENRRVPLSDHELIFELTYALQMKPWWTIQPDVQWISHPGGSRRWADALVLGLRSSIVF